jgi:tRNA-(ms[2]io[6]A)-hydroxylase
VLALASKTDPAWVERVATRLDELLVDHAHCEKKAASTALALVFRYPDHAWLVLPLSRLAREELKHFEQVVEVLRARGLEPRRQAPSPYAGALLSAVRTHEPARLLDTLLCCALIEARSCERMQLLARGLPDPGLRAFYGELLASEARHHATYVELARGIPGHGEAALRRRLAELAAHEARVLARAPADVRMHN